MPANSAGKSTPRWNSVSACGTRSGKPANRWGSSVYTPFQLKTIQEAITLVVFTLFSISYLGAQFRWTTAVGFLLILAGATLVFAKG